MALRGSRISGYATGIVVSLFLFSKVGSAPRIPRPHSPATFVVNSTGDASDATPGDGLCDVGGAVCTLRAAMEEANANAGSDTIHFAIGTGPQTITPATGFPAINETVTIDGTTQPGYSGTPLIELDGTNAGEFHGIHINNGPGSTIKGLMINRFEEVGIAINDAAATIEDCYIGTDATRTQDRGNEGDGISLNNDGAMVRDNVIAFNDQNGVAVYDAEINAYPDFTALTPDKTEMFPSIDFTDECGSFRHSAGAIIVDTSGRAFNEHFGMRLTATMSISQSGTYNFNISNVDDNARLLIDAVEYLNLTGTPGDADVALSMGDHSIEVDYHEGGGAANLVMGVSGPSTPTFSFSATPGFQGELFQMGIHSVDNTITENSIFDNAWQGIALGCCCWDNNDTGDIDVGPNNFLNFPDITNHFTNLNGSITVQGTAPVGSFVEVFGSTNDGSGRGEGKLYLTTSAIVQGDGAFIATFDLPQPYYSVTTTATDASGNTSEFSMNTPVRPRLITVTTSSDSGPGSLRAAIDEANGDGVDTLITFEPALIGVVIQLASPLPALTENETTINGDLNSDCHPDIEISGNGNPTAITINSQENTIRGLAIHSVGTQTILMDGGGAQNNSIICNYLGTTRTGLVAPGQGSFGVVGQNGAANNVIGRIGEGNLITGFDADGVRLDGGTFSVVRGNTIGLDANGNVLDPPNRGIQLINSNQNVIGESGVGNRIVAKAGGIDVAGGTNNTFRGNIIGWPEGTATPTGYGISLHSGANSSSIGGLSPGQGNVIERTGGTGVLLGWADGDNISIRGNSIANNGGLGIDLDGNGVTPNDGNGDADNGANENLNFPVLTRATTDGATTVVEGLIDTSAGGLEIDFYASSERDPSGYGEGATYIASHNVAAGSFVRTFPPLPVGTWLTATTNSGGHTSEFSLAIAVSTSPLGPTELTAWPADPAGISLRWRDPQSSETGFRIEGSNDGVSFYQVTNVGPDATTYTDSSLGPQQTVTYRVISTSPSGDSPPSNLATATTYSNAPVNVCRTNLSGQQQFAERASVVHNGTEWAVAWADKKNGAEGDIYFQRLADADGAPIGSPVQVSSTDASSQSPSLAWSGTQYGLLWRDHLRQASGEARSAYSFALLNNIGGKVRGDLRIGSNYPAGSNPDGQFPLIWDGGGWGIFTLEKVGGGSQQVVFYRLAANGDVLVNGVTALNTPAEKHSVSAAWNGTEYAFAYSLFPTGLRFVRMQPNGTAIGSFVNVGSTPGATTTGTSIVWDGSAWAMAWSDLLPSGDRVVEMRRIDSSGTPLGPSSIRISDDGAVSDEHPRIVNRPGGGFFIYTTGTVSGVPEVGRLEADANGDRVGSRITVSPSVGFASSFPRAATNGTSSLVAWQESGVNPSEIGVTVVDSAGVTGPLYNLTPGRIPPSHSTFPTVASVAQNRFVTVWNERVADGSALHARVVRGNGTFVDRKPLSSPAHPAARPAIASDGQEFAVAWTDSVTNSARFQRFDSEGIDLIPAYDIANPVDVGRGVGLATDGQIWGAAWVTSGQLRFQRLGSVAPIGTWTSIGGMPNPSDPKVQWVGSGWALLWSASGNFWYAMLDPDGALIVPPARVTDSFGNPSEAHLLWNGTQLGLAYAEGRVVLFTTIGLSGIKDFTPVLVANGTGAGFASLYFDGTDFHVVYPDLATGLRDVTVSPGGVLGSSLFAGNHGEGRIDAAWNGATLAMAWEHQAALLMQTSACLGDGTQPNCVTLNGAFTAGAVQLNWPAASDPQSGILAYHLYRDGALLAELLPTTLMYSDGGFTPGAAHVYELRAFNGAYLEATGCTPKTVTAGILVNPATLPNARQNQNYNQTITASQGTPTYSFAVTSGALPSNLILNPGSGAITGQPQNLGTFNFTITATDSLAATGSRAYTLRVCPQTLVAPTVLPDPIVNTAYSATLSASGTTDPVTFAVTSGALPAGLTLAANGVLSGTPTATGTFTFSVTASEPTGCTTVQAYTFDVRTGLAPRNVQADATAPSTILVRWTRPQLGETGFRIERSLDGVTWGSINNVGPDVTSHLDSGLTASSLYYYRVVAFSGATDAGTSNVAAATTFTVTALSICQRPIGIVHTRAQFASVAHDGAKWGAVWQDRNGGLLENVYFQFLDNTTGAPTGSPVQITQTEMLTRFPNVRWNGSHYGVLYTENLRSPAGDVTSTTNFALIDSAGSVVRKGVRVFNSTPGALNQNLILPLTWDGANWGVFATESRGNPPAEIYYWRLSPTGDVVTGPVRLTITPDWELELAAAWNGTEYGLTWIQSKDTVTRLMFQRMQADGTLIGVPQLLEQNAPGGALAMTAVTWNGSEWAVAYARTGEEWAIHLLRLNPNGTPIGSAVRISDDATPSQAIDDDYPVIVPKAGGGYLIFTVSFTPGTSEVARLEADASGNRVGSRLFLTSELDGLTADHVRMATDGTRFLLAHGANSPTQQEVATLITDATGAVTNGPTAITSGHQGGATQSPVIQRFGSGWVVVANNTTLSGGQLVGKLYDTAGTQTAAKVPLSPTTGVRSRIGLVSVGQTFAVVWRDSVGLRFCRFNSAGDPLISEVPLNSGGNQAGLAWNGEQYGTIFFEGSNLRFQRIDASGTLQGPKVSVATGQNAIQPQLSWIGTGWAVVWRRNNDLFYALLDSKGAFVVPPLQVTFTGTSESNPQIAWTGDRLGLVWTENLNLDPPGSDIFFTVLRPDGTKDFAPKNVVSTPYGDGFASIYWKGDRFGIVHINGQTGTREIFYDSSGTLLAGERLYYNRSVNMNVAWNGISLGMVFNGLFDLTLQNSSCFNDTTPPPCPNTGMPPTFDGVKIRVGFPLVSDPESGILGYNIYRDGAHIAEVSGSPNFFDDFGFVPGATHAYEVRALNGAYLESPGCTIRSVVAGISVNPTTLPNGNVGSNFNVTFTGSQGTSPYTFAVTAGALPPGLSLNGTSGALTGNPTAGGIYNFTITATDALSQTGSRAYSLRVCAGLTIFPSVLIEGYLDRDYSQTIVTAGANGSVTLSLTTGALPTGLTMDAAGWIHGTPTATGTFPFTIMATDATGCTSTRNYSVVIQNGQAVRSLSAFALGTSSIRLRWTDPQRNETSFRIERSPDLGATWAPITIVGPDTVTSTDAALAAGTTFSYRVVATTPSGDASPSNVATASTFPATAAKTCLQPVSPYHSSARNPTVTWTGTQWAMVWSERTGGREDDLFFTFLDANGAMTGSPKQITTMEMGSLRSALRWNGSKFGVMFTEIHRGPAGEAVNEYRFALLDATGTVIRTDVMIARPAPVEFSSQTADLHLFWDGSAWSFFETHFTSDGLMDIFFYRFDEDGDMLAGPTRLTTHPNFDTALSVAWNGTEYALSWGRFIDNVSSIEFQRVSSSGALVGSQVTIAAPSTNGTSNPDVAPTPTGWAVAWREPDLTNGFAIMLQRLSAAGALIGSPSRVNDDFDLNGFSPANQRPAIDNFPDLFTLADGSFVVFTIAQLNVTGRQEVAMVRADAAGVRVGSRIVLSAQDNFNSNNARVATNGTNFLAGFNEIRLGTLEVASLITTPSGSLVAGPTDLTTGHSAGFTVNTSVAPLGGGFAALFVEPLNATTNQVYARIFDGTGALAASKSPLSTQATRGRAAIVGVGSTFATVWKTPTNSVVFGRWDAAGNALFPEVNVATGAGGPQHVNVGFDGETYGVLWNQGGRLNFQRVSPAGVLLGTRAILANPLDGQPQQMVWTSLGWAIVFISGNDVYYTLLDVTGATIVAPMRISFTPTFDKVGLALTWNGDVLGLAWTNYPIVDPPGLVVQFTVLNLDGIKQFTETVVAAEGRFDNNVQGLYWDADRFKVIFSPGEGGTLRSVDVSLTGAVLGPSRMLSNRGFGASIAFNGTTAGMIWLQSGDQYFQTTACLDDVTPPSCPTLSATRTAGGIALSWTPATDAQSGIYRYVVYRDGLVLGETPASLTTYTDASARINDSFTYSVVAQNGAFLLSSSCASQTVIGNPANLVATATSATQVQVTWDAVGGATSYSIERSTSGLTFTPVGTSPTASFNHTVTAGTSYLYRARAVVGAFTSDASNHDLATTILFTDDPLVVGVTRPKSVHVTQLRTAVNAVRALAGLSPATFTGSAAPGTAMTATHVNELRTALASARTALSLSAVPFTNTIAPGVIIRAIDVQELRNGVK